MMGPKVGKAMGRMTAYAYFVQLCREEHKKQCPGELLEYQLFSKKCAEKWKTMTDREKKYFRQLESRDQKRYEADQAKFKSMLAGKVKNGNAADKKPGKSEKMAKAISMAKAYNKMYNNKTVREGSG